jgi:hypothetical protein
MLISKSMKAYEFSAFCFHIFLLLIFNFENMVVIISTFANFECMCSKKRNIFKILQK